MFCCHAQRLPSPLQTAMPFTDWHFKIIYKNIDHSRTSQTASFLPSCHSTRQGCSAHGSKGQNPVMPSLSHPSDPSNDGMPWDAASPTSEKRSALSEFIAINSPNFIHKYPHYSKHLETINMQRPLHWYNRYNDVQWCTMMYNVCFDKYSWCPPDAFPKAVWSYRSTEKMSHSLRRHPYIQTKTVHSCWFSDFQWNVKSAWTQGKTVLARVIVISFVWFCDPLWSFVILRDPLWSFVILGKHLLTLCAFTSRLMTSGSGISRGLCSQGMQFKVL